MGEWQKVFVNKLIKLGITHETAMLIMASTCEERLNAYMEGYDKGYNIGFTQGQTFKKSENKETSCGFD